MNFTLSVVSHGSGALIANLLTDLRRLMPVGCEVILTINVPEDEAFLLRFADLPVRVFRNSHPFGFGANHNRAFAASHGSTFVVINPDIRLETSPFEHLAAALRLQGTGACAPVIVAPAGTVEDSVRRYPTVGRLLKRVILGRRTPDYDVQGVKVRPVDWAAGMFLAFNRSSFEKVGGFDTRYFMYMEDADICRRLWSAGLQVLLVPRTRVIHEARRASRRNLRHLAWHLQSAWRFLVIAA